MELKMTEYQRPQSIAFNYEELKEAVERRAALYETVIYTEDQVKAAKSDRAALNRLKKALNDERISQEKEYMQPFNAFKAQINEIISIIDRPIMAIDKQVKAFEEQQRKEKKEEIYSYWLSCDVPDGMQDAQTFEKMFDDKWLNASVPMKNIKDAINNKLEQARNELEIVRNFPNHALEAEVVYISTLDFSKAVCEANRLAEMDKMMAAMAAERAKAAEDKPAEQPREWVAFQALLSTDEAKALGDYFKQNGIEYKAV